MAMSAPSSVSTGSTAKGDWLSDPEFRKALGSYVRRKVRAEDADDVVQSVLVEALAAPSIPPTVAEFRRWIFAVARNTIADHYRKRKNTEELGEQGKEHGEFDWIELERWLERLAIRGDDHVQTMQWMAREADGEKLEHIAQSEGLPAPQVRQRVSRLRRFLRKHWQAELALMAAIAILSLVLARKWEQGQAKPTIVPSPEFIAPDIARGKEARRRAFEACDRQEWQPCLEGLDEAKRLDPAGDATNDVETMRAKVKEAIEKPQVTDPSIPEGAAIPFNDSSKGSIDLPARKREPRPQKQSKPGPGAPIPAPSAIYDIAPPESKTGVDAKEPAGSKPSITKNLPK